MTNTLKELPSKEQSVIQRQITLFLSALLNNKIIERKDVALLRDIITICVVAKFNDRSDSDAVSV